MSNEIGGVVVVALILALVEAGKAAGLPRRYAALASALTGLALVGGYQVATGLGQRDLFEAVIQGLAAGLAASGLYSATHALGCPTPTKTPTHPRARGAPPA